MKNSKLSKSLLFQSFASEVDSIFLKNFWSSKDENVILLILIQSIQLISLKHVRKSRIQVVVYK